MRITNRRGRIFRIVICAAILLPIIYLLGYWSNNNHDKIRAKFSAYKVRETPKLIEGNF